MATLPRLDSMKEYITIDLNADLGEGMPYDEQIMQHISSVNIGVSCYTGNPQATRDACRLAAEHQVTVGVHLGYSDVKNFGRKSLEVSDLELDMDIVYQKCMVKGGLELYGAEKLLKYFKPHGALYHDTIHIELIRNRIIKASNSEKLPLLLQAGFTDFLRTMSDMPIYDEGFADRRYTSDGKLVPRSEPGAVLAKAEDVAQQAVALAMGTPIETADGGQLRLKVDSICVHGDSEGALESILAVKEAFGKARIGLKPFAK